MNAGAVVILQARMASTRLPGKAMASLGRRSMLAACLARLRAGASAPVLLATTARPEDDVLEAEASREGVSTFRGPGDDVLRRFVLAAHSVDARYVVRATADNPGVDIGAPARVLELLTSSDADHVIEVGLPYGSAVEAVSVAALERAAEMATDALDREHVTSLIRRDAMHFHALRVAAPDRVWRPDLRLTVDTLEDLERMRRIVADIDHRGDAGREPSLEEFMAAADRVAMGELVR